MDVLSFAQARARLDGVMDAVVADHNPVVIVPRKGEAVVLVSLADWRMLEETQHLLSSLANAERLRQASDELNADGEA